MKVITIAGGIGKDAEVRRTQSGDAVTGFSVAVSDRQKNTTWFDVSMWGKRGEALAPYLTKGGKVTVSGEFGTREYEGKTYLTVNANDVTPQGGKSGGGGDYCDKKPTGQGAPADLDDEIPFMLEWR